MWFSWLKKYDSKWQIVLVIVWNISIEMSKCSISVTRLSWIYISFHEDIWREYKYVTFGRRNKFKTIYWVNIKVSAIRLEIEYNRIGDWFRDVLNRSK